MAFGYIDPGSGYTIFSLGTWLITFFLAFLGFFLLFFKKIFNFFKRRKKFSFLILVILISGALTWVGTVMNKKQSDFKQKIIILGFDALSPEILEPMMREGKLPNFSRLKDEGSYKRLSTTLPPQSPVAWTGFATGQNPGKNGIFDFIIRDPKTYQLNLSLSQIEGGKPHRVIKSQCFWNYLSRKRIPSYIITCPITFPPDKIYGRMLSGMGVPDILGTEGTFTFYTSGPIDETKPVGGKVFQMKKFPVMNMELIGPRVSTFGGKKDNVKVPFKVVFQKDQPDTILIKHQNNSFLLKKDTWSDWQEVTFKIGPFKKIKGIFKFYLVETEPDIKLYISPINFDPRSPFMPISYPGNYSRELVDHIGLYHTQGMPIDTWAVNEKRLSEKALLEQANEILREKEDMLNFELNRFNQGVLFCYFETPDIIQHMFWRYIDPKHPLYEANAPQEYKETIRNWYQKMDKILGGVMNQLDEDTILIVLSDHGFNTFRRVAHVNSWLRENGYLNFNFPYAESSNELLEDVNWETTRAYAIGFNSIYINQKGREKNGIVRPGEETEKLKEEIAEKLKKWRDEKYDQPVVNNVYKREDVYRGKYLNQTPDLLIGFNVGYRASWQTALGGVPVKLIEDNMKAWSGCHLFDPALVPGIILSNRKITKDNPSIYDITPTILKISGYSREEIKKFNLDGTLLFEEND